MSPRQPILAGVVVAFLVVNAKGVLGQAAAVDQVQEQTVFEAEADSPVSQPAKIPDSALQVLGDTLTGGTF